MGRVPPHQPHLVEKLVARIDSLKRHATALEQAFRGEALKSEARDLIRTLDRTEEVLRGTPTDDGISAVEDALDAATVRLSGLGRA
jgi:hypothetical protein